MKWAINKEKWAVVDKSGKTAKRGA